MFNPVFSIIVPSYNRAKKLPTAILSILDQRFINFELIIVDDGSVDNTREVIQSFNDKRIKYLYQANKGVCAARNKGVFSANGEYLTFLDSDDKADKDWLHNFYELIQLEPAKLIFCDMNLHYQDGKVRLRRALYRYNENVPNENGMFMPGSFCIQSDLMKSIGGFDEKIRFGEFTDLDFTLLQLCISRAFTNKVGIHYYPAPDGGGKNQKNKIDAIIYLLDKHKMHFQKDKNAKWLYLQNLAVSYIRLSDFSKASEYFLKAWFIKPWKVKTIVRLFISFFPRMAKKTWA
jgi:glycosyltransferase involved in cell wall biosynthesis